MKWLSFITQFKIEFLLHFTSCRKVLEKMPECKMETEFLLYLAMLQIYIINDTVKKLTGINITGRLHVTN